MDGKNGLISPGTIILDLSRSETGNVGREGNLIQIDAQKKLFELINDQVDRLEVPSKSSPERSSFQGGKGFALSYARPHNAILIEGGRGSGKTTFLLQAIESMDSKYRPYERVGQHLKVLPMVDPTLIETKQNIIVLILSLIETAVEHCNDEYGLLDEARQDLAEGLGLLDGIGHATPYGAEWEDASWVMSRGLEKARKGHSFERRLNLYLERALALLGARAFVLTFDDLDTNFVHGFTILETIRKYLTSPRLVLILSGDLDLYGRLLRQSIYKNFGEQVLKTDIDVLERAKADVAGSVLELEEQYLLKIVPPQHRISMLPLGGVRQKYPELLLKTHASHDGVSPQASGESDAPHSAQETKAQPERLEKWASERIRRQLLEIPQASRPHSFFTLVEMEHMRMVIGYLRALQRNVDDSRQSVLTVFEARMRANGLPADIIERGVFEYTLRVVFEWFVKQEDASDLLRFGIPSNRNKAIALHCLALSLGNFLDKRFGASLKTLLSFALPVAMMRRPTLSDQANRSLICDFLWSQASPSTPELAARIGAIDRAGRDGKSSASSFGTVAVVNKASQAELIERLYGPKLPVPDKNNKIPANQNKLPVLPTVTVKLLKEQHNVKWKTRWLDALVEANQGDLEFAHGVTWFKIDELLSEDRLGDFSGILNLVVNRRFTTQGTVNRTVSALSLLAVITEMLMDEHNTPISEFAVTTIVPALSLRGASGDLTPPVIDEEDSSDDEKSIDKAIVNTVNEGFKNFLKNMVAWKDFARSLGVRAEVAPSTIGQMAQRLHDDLISLDSKVPKNWKVGETLHRQITTMLHGVISVTSEHVGRRESPKMSDRPLIELLGRLQHNKLSPLGAILLSCPLIWAFLDPAEEEGHGGANAVRLRKAAVAALTLSYPPTQQPSADEGGEALNYEGWVKAPDIEVLINSSATDGVSESAADSARSNIPKVRGFYDLLNVVPRYV